MVEGPRAGDALVGESSQCTLRGMRFGCQWPGEYCKDANEAYLSRCGAISESELGDRRSNKNGSQGLDWGRGVGWTQERT